jgi:hypothetical protein
LFVIKIEKYKIELLSSGVEFVPDFMKICRLVHSVLGGQMQGHDVTDDQSFLLTDKECRLRTAYQIVIVVKCPYGI